MTNTGPYDFSDDEEVAVPGSGSGPGTPSNKSTTESPIKSVHKQSPVAVTLWKKGAQVVFGDKEVRPSS
jgi:hypothetical protein